MNTEQLIAPQIYNIVDEYEKHVNKGEKTALIIQEENGEEARYTYEALLDKANQAANAFLAQGLKKGDVILIMLPRCIEAYVSYIGA